MALHETTCCGIDEIDGLSRDPKDTLLEVCQEKYDNGGWGDVSRQAYIIFHDANKNGNGIAMAKYITKNNLGDIVSPARSRINPNSRNYIRAWVWSPDEKLLKAWWKKNRDESYY